MTDIRYQEDFFFAESSKGLRQSAHNVAMGNADIDRLSPLANPTTPATERTRRTVFNCNGTRIYKEPITSQFDRWVVSYEATAYQIAKALAFVKGATTSPSGTPADEVQTITIDATGGTFTITFAFEGLTGTTPALAWNAPAASVQAALEKLDSIGKGNVTVGLVGLVYTLTFAGKLAKANVSAVTTNAASLTGGAGTAAVATTTAGANKYHLITDSVSPVLNEFSFFTGYESDDETYLKHKNAVVIRTKITIPRRGIATCEREIICSSETELDPTFVVPDCVIDDPLEAEDCKIKWGTDFVHEDIESIEVEFLNNTPTDNNLFPWAGRNIANPTKGRQPNETVVLSIQGSETDQIVIDAEAEGENGTEKELILYLGVPGERVVLTYPKMSLKRNGGIAFDQTSGKTIVSMNGQPHDDTALGAYSKAEYYGAATTQILST